MAVNESPIDNQPNTPSSSTLPRVPNLSPNPSSSSDSFGSSRPTSQASSATSRSVSSSPAAKCVPEIGSDQSIELSALPSTPAPPENPSASQPQGQTESPRSVQPTSAVSQGTNHEARHRGNWFSNTLGSLNFGLALIGMLVLGQLAVWTSWNDATATCAQIASVCSLRLCLV